MLRQVLVDALRTRQRIAHARGARMPRALKRCLYSQKSNNNASFQVDFLKSAWAALFGNRGHKGGSFDAPLRAVVCGRGDPSGSEGLLVRFA
jgi:hypothetical protein